MALMFIQTTHILDFTLKANSLILVIVRKKYLIYASQCLLEKTNEKHTSEAMEKRRTLMPTFNEKCTVVTERDGVHGFC